MCDGTCWKTNDGPCCEALVMECLEWECLEEAVAFQKSMSTD